MTRQQRYAAVYGAMVAAQVQERFRLGLGAPDDDDMERFVGEAECVAEMADEAYVRVNGLVSDAPARDDAGGCGECGGLGLVRGGPMEPPLEPCPSCTAPAGEGGGK